MKVHTELGPGFNEHLYQNALSMEMESTNVNFKKEQTVPVIYNGRLIGIRRADFLVDDVILVELKSLPRIYDGNVTQTLKYLEAFKLPVGLLINFGAGSLEFKRIYNSKHPLTIAARK